jgi:hypothetical protein
VKWYLKALIPRSLEHMLLYQKRARSLALPCSIVHTDDPRYKKRRNANSTSPLWKRKPLLSIYYESLITNFPVPIEYLRSLAFITARQRSSVFQASATDETINPPGKNWPQAFYKRHPELNLKRVRALDWDRQGNILNLNHRRIRNHGFLFITASGRISRSKS